MGLFKKSKTERFESKIIVAENNVKGADKGYTRLKDNILYLNADGKNKVLQIESALSQEGKTTVTANLAVSLGFTDKKVIVVDLDFRRPRTHRKFNLQKDNGIAEYLKGELTKEQIIKKTEFANVDVITRGEQIHNSSLALVSDKFKTLISELRNEYDYVLLDCAPVLQVSDYIHVSSVSDGVLFLVAFGKTTKGQVAEAVNQLKKNEVKILGTVFTMYDRKKDSDYTPYYGKYSYNYIDNE